MHPASEVVGIGGVIWGRTGLNLYVPGDRNTARLKQIEAGDRIQPITDLREEYPIASASGTEISLALPLAGFVGMPSIDPCDQRVKYLVVDIGKGLLGDHMTVVVGPASDPAIKLLD